MTVKFKCPITIPDPETAKTPTEKTGLINAKRFSIYAENGLEAGTLPIYKDFFNRKAAAAQLNFGRSAYSSNDYIEKIADWIDKELGQKSRQLSSSRNTQKERELERENQRLKNRLAQLRVSLDEANCKLREYGYIEEELANGQVRLPW